MTTPAEHAKFDLVQHVVTSYDVPVTKFRSPRTGLEVAFVHIDTPLVNGFFALPTEEADDLIDKGLPHTLEHLIFLGSEDYPYKGVLDTLANRARARGTNAWTATDHTAYTVTTAGSAGFRQILPIFLDHVLYPTLTETGYTTEVYHVNGKGEDGGVVYSEMQGRENTPEDLASHRMLQLLYPPPSGYCSETGGLMRKLRELDIDQIRKYHARFYRPDTLCLVITGTVDQAAVLDALVPFEDKIAAKGPLPEVPRPWVGKPIKPLEESVTETLLFPDEDESMGSVYIAWRGPAIGDALALAKLDALLMYLTDSSVAVLQQAFVECDDAVATDVAYYQNSFAETSMTLILSSVATEKLASVPDQVLAVLRDHEIDAGRMRSVLDLRRLRTLNQAESDPSYMFAAGVIAHHLYGDRDTAADLLDFVDENRLHEALLAVEPAEWAELLRTHLVDAPRVTLLATPSAARADEIAAADAERVAKRLEDPEDLAKRQAEVDAAIAANDAPVPAEIIEGFPIAALDAELPHVESAQLPPAARFADSPLQAEVAAYVADNGDFPVFVQLDAAHSQFIGLALVLDSSSIPKHLRMYLALYLEALFALPLQKPDGTVVPYEAVVAGLNADTVSFGAGAGSGAQGGASFAAGAYESQITVALRVTPDKYATGVDWIRTLVRDAVFDLTRLTTIAKNMLADVPQLKRDAMKMATWTIKSLLYSDESNQKLLALPQQVTFLQALVPRLEAKDEAVAADLAALRDALLATDKVRVHVTGALRRVGVPAILDPWRAVVADIPTVAGPATGRVPPTAAFRSLLGRMPKSTDGNGKLVRVPATESGYLLATAHGVESATHADLAAVQVAFEIFSTMEGFFWKQIRGPGLAYGAYLAADPNAATVGLGIYRANNVVQAYARARAIVADVLSGTGELAIDQTMLDSAKAAVAYGIVAREDSPRAAAAASFTAAVLHGVPAEVGHYHQWLLNEIENVDMDTVLKACRKYLPRLFDPASALVVVATGPAKVDEVQRGFAEMGIELAVVAGDQE
ncbi:Presequence protease, mitochondrial [Allomyces arbusculus]|nr:Presequence protease, mitochondrial [Allomyces arbusculus]